MHCKSANPWLQAPNEGYWPSLVDREAELWDPLLMHARLAGMEARALAAALELSGRKQAIQAEDLQHALARELLEALEGWKDANFAPSELIESLADSEAWGARLAEKHEAKAKAAAIGHFIRTLRLESRQRTRQGTRYQTAEAILKLQACLPEKTATSATSATGAVESTTYSVADVCPILQPNEDASATRNPVVAVQTGPVADSGNASATLKPRINGGVVADVADVAVSAGTGEGYWGEL